MTEKNIGSDYCDLMFNITNRTTYGDEKTAEDINNIIDISNLSVIITEKNNKFAPIIFPKEDQLYLSTDQFFLFTQRIFWNADDVFNFTVKIGELEKEFTFTVPRPEQPYPFWTWSNGQWISPISYPKDGKMYSWNEEKINWELTED